MLSDFLTVDNRDSARQPPSPQQKRSPRPAERAAQSVAAARPESVLSAPVPPAESVAAISSDIDSCKRCNSGDLSPVHGTGRGSGHPRLMVVGDYCSHDKGNTLETVLGSQEDVMLRKMMQAISLSDDEVYVTNLIKCRTAAAHRPDPTVAASCFSYLAREIASLRPEIICAMGDMAAQHLLGRSEPLVRLRGVFHDYRYAEGGESPVIVTFHPRFLLANAEMKKAAWQDLQKIQRRLGSSNKR